MIAYIFSENEFKLLCGIMKLNLLSEHQFSNSTLTDYEYKLSLESLSKKGFISFHNEIAEINSCIYVMLSSMNNAFKLYKNIGESVFTGYISEGISLLLLSRDSKRILYPFKNEQLMNKWLEENGILYHAEITLNRSVLNG